MRYTQVRYMTYQRGGWTSSPPSPPIGGRTTFRTKVRLNIKILSIKGEVKIRVIIIKSLIRVAHKFLATLTLLIGERKESLQ
jgi:hypothetical protein